MLETVLAISLCLQVAAAVLALRLIRVTGQRTAWVLIAAAISLMVVRRSIAFINLFTGNVSVKPDLGQEVVALSISVLMLAGIAWIRPLILSIRRAEQEVRQLIASAPDAMIIANAEDRIVLANAEALRLFGYLHSELIGASVEKIIPERFRERHREQRAAFLKNPRRRVLRAEDEVYGARKDGTEVPIEVSVSPLQTTEGPLIVSAIRDISARRKAEEALRESEGRYRSLLDDVLDSSSVGACILDQQMHVVWVNRAFEGFFGLQRAQVVGRDAHKVVRDRLQWLFEDPTVFRDKVLKTYQDNSYTEHFECHITAAEGRDERWLEHWSQPIESGLYAGGRIEHYTDTTERALAEERIRLFAQIARDMQIGLLVYRLDDPDDDRSLRLLTVNDHGVKLLGVPAEGLMGQPIDEAFPNLREHGIPKLFAGVVTSGETQEIRDFAYGDARVSESLWSFKAFRLPDQCVGVVFDRYERGPRDAG